MENVISHESNPEEIPKKNQRFVLLDTNFILSCVKNKIDFFNEIPLMGYNIIIPKEVIKEIENISKSKQKLKEKDMAKLASVILKMNQFKKINLNTKNVDNGIIQFAKQNPDVIVATLDRVIKNSLKKKNKIMIIRENDRLEIVG